MAARAHRRGSRRRGCSRAARRGAALAAGALLDAARADDREARARGDREAATRTKRERTARRRSLGRAQRRSRRSSKQLLAAGADPKHAQRLRRDADVGGGRSSATRRSSKRCSTRAPTSSSRNADGQTALMVVARTGNVAAAKLLIDHGADVNARESRKGADRADVGRAPEPAGDGRAACRARRRGRRALDGERLGAAASRPSRGRRTCRPAASRRSCTRRVRAASSARGSSSRTARTSISRIPTASRRCCLRCSMRTSTRRSTCSSTARTPTSGIGGAARRCTRPSTTTRCRTAAGPTGRRSTTPRASR